MAEAATLQAWEAAAAKALKGRPVVELDWATLDGLRLKALYTAEDGAEPVWAPRGPVADAERPWDVRAVVSRRDPADSNTQALADLNGGARSLLLVVDPAADGIALGSRDELGRVLDGVLLDLAPVALDAGFLGPEAAGWLGELAKGAPRAPLALHLDPLSAFAAQGVSPGPMAAHLHAAAETAVRLGEIYPEASLMLASGRVVHEAGGGEALELGFALASALAYARALDAAGLPAAEAFGRIVLGLSVEPEYFTAIAKLRAGRLMWARMAGACGAPPAVRIEARSSRRTLSTLDPWTNLLRVGASAFASAVGGADAVVVEPFSQPLGAADAFAARQARNTQLVLMEEAALGRVADSASGSAFLDAYTRELAAAGWAAFQAIEARGGALAALLDGHVAEQVRNVAQLREAELRDGMAALIGVTRFRDASGRAPTVAAEPDKSRDLPDGRLPGADDHCPPLTPQRLAQPYEQEASA